ncbi:MAG: hypothetical protein ED557_04675 [Balneola sp.]|nr:MAG: hypothetical protein ED557_04675 [Balneola sp.]
MLLKKLWNSPTVTQYGKYISTLGSAVILLPIILSKFQSTDIAIWLLISTVTTFSSILSSRLQITFMRVVSFAFAGAKDYKPIVDYGKKRGDGKPNWLGIQDIFITLSKTFFYVALVSTIIVVIGLSFGVNNLVESYTREYIFITLIVAISTLFTENFIKYNIFLMGFNEVALVNRWNTLFGVISIAGALTIVSIGGGLLELVVWQRLIPMISALRDNWLFNNYLKERDIQKEGNFDKEILYAVKEPLWKGLVAHASQMGMVQFSGVIFTAYGDPAVVAAYLFSLRILTILAQFAQVPFSSKNPYYSQLRSEGNTLTLAKVFQNRIVISLATYTVGVVTILLVNEFILELIGSNISFVSNETWLLMGLFYGVERANILYQAILASANHVVLYIEQIIAAIISLVGLLIFVGTYGIVGIILALFLPRTILFNVRALKYAADSLHQNLISFGWRTFSPILILLLVYIVILL